MTIKTNKETRIQTSPQNTCWTLVYAWNPGISVNEEKLATVLLPAGRDEQEKGNNDTVGHDTVVTHPWQLQFYTNTAAAQKKDS